MRLETISVQLGQKVNLGNYNSADISVFGTIRFNGDETDEDRRRQIEQLKDELQFQIVDIRSTLGPAGK